MKARRKRWILFSLELSSIALADVLERSGDRVPWDCRGDCIRDALNAASAIKLGAGDLPKAILQRRLGVCSTRFAS